MKKNMKKILATLLMTAGLFTACDMDKAPFGSLDDQTGIQTLNDCKRFRNILYTNMRSRATGAWINSQEIQMDIFQGLMDNGNQVGTFANGNILSSDQDIESMWASMYSTINSANFIIEKIDKLSETFSDEEKAMLNRYNAEAHFVRAYCYFWLMDHFCPTYSSATATAAAQGVPVVTQYNPTADRSKYPGRSTQDEVYTLINGDLEVAYTGLKAFEAAASANAAAPNAVYFTSYAVEALQARIALVKGDNTTALAKAESVINAGVYTLTGIDDYAAMWSTDEGSEVIFRPFMSNTELGNATGSYFLSDNNESAWYIPTYAMLSMYEENDIRFETFFLYNESLKVSGTNYPAYVFNKYPGNESLKTGTQRNFVNMNKPFRLSELYLIAAEASAGTDATKANKYLNDLRKKRIADYTEQTYNSAVLVNEIRTERLKELIGEGFRMSDLRRWNQGFERDASYPINPDIVDGFVSAGKGLTYAAGDHRFVWPIPATEIQSNPQLDGQQNSGY